MNITELARQVSVPTQKLREILPQIGFDIGAKAIKVDDKTAEKIIKKFNDPKIKNKFLEEKEIQGFIANDKESEKADSASGAVRKIKIGETIIVKNLAEAMNMPINKLVLELIKNGVMASLNQSIDFDTASIIASDFGFEVEKDDGLCEIDWEKETEERAKYFADIKENLSARPPVVVVMGHVDHGKTKLLDAIRETNVVDSEAGGITQHIGAYQVEKNNQLITFIDTPGHEAFSTMRSRGAQVADIAILIVAADDGVQPQTIEALSHIKSAGLPFIVAINKIDKPGVNIDKVKAGLAELNLTPEDWGGKTITAEVSAKERINIDGLLDMLLLVYEMEKENIQGNHGRCAVGTIIESHIDKGKGPVATCLVQTGTLDIGDVVKIGNTVSRIRALKNWLGEDIEKAGPSMPAQILGLKSIAHVGDILCEIKDKKEIRSLNKLSNQKDYKLIHEKKHVHQTQSSDENKAQTRKVNLMLKADVFGSIEAILESLTKIKYKNICVDVVKKSLGNINEGDVEQATDSDSILIGFNVKATAQAEALAITKNVDIKIYNIIYELLDFVKTKVNELISPELVTKKLGSLKVSHIFKTGKNEQILGGKVINGKIVSDCKINVLRADKVIGTGDLTELQCSKEKVSEVVEDQECGLQISNFNNVKPGDVLEFFQQENIQQKI